MKEGNTLTIQEFQVKIDALVEEAQKGKIDNESIREALIDTADAIEVEEDEGEDSEEDSEEKEE